MTQTAHTLRLIDEFLTQGGHAHGIDADTLEREAALVAAAPDLLETLRYVLLADAYDGALTMGTAALSTAIRDRIKRTIAKATGEETDA